MILGQVRWVVRKFSYLCEWKQVFQQLILLLFHILVLCKVDLFRLSNDLFLFDFSSNASQEVFYLLTNRNTRNFDYIQGPRRTPDGHTVRMALFQTFLQSVATRCSGVSSVFRASIKSSNSISGFKYGLTNIYGVFKTKVEHNTGKPEITICF